MYPTGKIDKVRHGAPNVMGKKDKKINRGEIITNYRYVRVN